MSLLKAKSISAKIAKGEADTKIAEKQTEAAAKGDD